MAKSYDELVGGVGPTIAYRPERHLVRDFLDEHAATVVPGHGEAEGVPRRLYDISMNGVSFIAPPEETPWAAKNELDVQILVGEDVAYQGRARVVRAEPKPEGVLIGLHLQDRFLDLPQMRARFEERALEKDLRDGPDQWRRHVSPEYRQVVEEAANFLNFYQQSLDKHAQRYEQVGDARGAAISALALRALDYLREPWNALCRKAAKLALPCFEDPELFRATKRYTETVLAPLVISAPVLERCFTKPLGYAGDYQTMGQIYRNELEGSTAYARVFHKLGCEEPLAAGVRGRKDLAKEIHIKEHRRVLAQEDQEKVFRVTSLGSGLAREICDFIQERRSWPGHIEWTLIDQEEQVLSLSYQNICRELLYDRAAGQVQCMYVSFSQLLRRPDLVALEESQDFIYALGLFDYIQDRLAQRLIGTLYDRLASGGLLMIANALWPNTHFWVTEFIVDWSLIYRTREDMLRLARKVVDPKEIEVVTEPAGAYYCLLLRKP